MSHDEIGNQDSSRQASFGKPLFIAAHDSIESTVPTDIQAASNGAYPSQTQRERASGISEYVCPSLNGFVGILKRRYTDFLVNEVLPNGEVLHLRNLHVPKIESHLEVTPSNEQRNGKYQDMEPGYASTTGGMNNIAVNGPTPPHEKDQELLKSLLGVETYVQMQALHQKIMAHPKKKPRDFQSVRSSTIDSKERRTEIHQAIRKVYHSRLESRTEEDNTILIKCSPNMRKNKGGDDTSVVPALRGKLGWEQLGGEYVHFTIYKENKDTMEVISYLARELRTNVKHFQFGGTKDRRAVTVQRASAYRIRAEQLAAVGKRLRGAIIGDFEYRQDSLELGELGGNEFTITLRDCEFREEILKQESITSEQASLHLQPMVEAFAASGFINYYGLQRFGSFAIGTDVVGARLLNGDFRSAVDGILSFSPNALTASTNPESRISSDDVSRAEAIHLWTTTGESQKALEKLPRKFSAEANIIRHLGTRNKKTGSTNSRDYQGALQTIQRNLRLMYVHAYQSLVWNVVAGRRWEMFGDRIVAGDLVLVHEHQHKVRSAPVRQEVDEQGEVVVHPTGTDSASTAEQYERARALTEDDAASGEYSIFDIVLPLPGYDVVYPPNAVGEEYKTFMASDRGGGLDPHNMRRSWKDFSLSGGYRKLLSRPAAVSLEVKQYLEADEQLVLTDGEGLKGVSATNAKATPKSEQGDVARPTRLAVILRMKLGPSQYATMALRELMKSGLQEYKPQFFAVR